MIAFETFQAWVVYGLIILSFAINFLFLGKKIYAFSLKSDIKKRVLAAVVLLSIFSSGMFLFSFAAVRGGYDNNHDVEYLSTSFFDTKNMEDFLKIKEVSPLITDGISDIVSGFLLMPF